MSNHVYEVQAPSDPYKVVARIYGPTGMLFERAADVQNYRLVQSVGLAPKLIASDENGRVETFLEGYVTLNSRDLRCPSNSASIARSLAQFHLKTTAELTAGIGDRTRTRPMDIWNRLREWEFRAKEINPNLMNDLECTDIEREVFEIQKELREETDRQLCFCHCDLQHGNIMKHPSKDEICFVDYEYGCLGPMELDIANHWCEWCADYNAERSYVLQISNFPTVQQQSEFLKHYLTVLGNQQSESSFELGTTIEKRNVSDILPEIVRRQWIEMGFPTETMIERLRTRVLSFVPLAHLVWMLWSVIQDAISDVDFNFRGHAEHRRHQIKYWIDYHHL